MRNLQVTVIGDSSIDSDQYIFCELLGNFLGENKVVTITGGRGGIMEAVSKGVFDSGGITVSILPSDQMDQANAFSRITIPTGLGHARNSLTVQAADIVIVIGGKAGTLSEVSFAWIYDKPILAVTSFGGWALKVANKKIDDRRKDGIIACDSLNNLKTSLIDLAGRLGWSLKDM